MNEVFINNIGDLAEAQRASFYRFLSRGIREELLSFQNPFYTSIKVPTRAKKKVKYCPVYLYINELKLQGPNCSIEESLKQDATYSIGLYVPGEYAYDYNRTYDSKKLKKYFLKSNKASEFEFYFPPRKWKKKEEKKIICVKQDIFLGEIPLMTEEGTFILNGCERVVISQIIRSPGIYFRKEFGTTKKALYTATIISDRGSWSTFVLDEVINFVFDEKMDSEMNSEIKTVKKDRIYLKLNEYKTKDIEVEEKPDYSDDEKLFIYSLIRYFEIDPEQILDSLKYPLLFEEQQLTREKNKRGEQMSAKEKRNSDEDVLFTIEQFFLNPYNSCFSIGEIGRYNINKKLGLNLPKHLTYLTPQDFFGIIDGLLELKYYDRLSDDIDHIKNKQIRSIGEFLQNQVRVGFYRVQQYILKEKIKFETSIGHERISKNWIIDSRIVTSAVKEFFKGSELSQFMDQTNPLAEMTHKRRISVFGPNGLKRDHISTVIRDIHPSQYGRLCPIETPEGQNAGLITSLSMYGRISSMGWIETPYFLANKSSIFLKKPPIFLNPEEESKVAVAFADFSLNQANKVNAEYLSVKEDYSFSVKKRKDVNFITISPLQIMSLATALIPFVEHDDANRALMGSNMQRQAVPLIYAQKPIVGTGLESVAILDSGMVIKAYSEGIVIRSSCNSIVVEDVQAQKIIYCLRKHFRSNQETSMNQKPIVWPGEKVFAGQIIADGPSTNDGELALGRNLTIAYMPWEGYNYEDAIVINEQLIYDDCLSSLHIEEQEAGVGCSLIGEDKLLKNLPSSSVSKYETRHLDDNGVVKIGSYVKEYDVLVGKLTPCEEDTTPESRLIKAITGNNAEPFRDTSLRVEHGSEGRVIDIRVLEAEYSDEEDDDEEEGGEPLTMVTEKIRIYIAHIRKVQIGDKLAGRHGNKGIISRVLSRQDMPYLPDGTPIDIIFNPLGVPSRMNVGQIFECLLGLAGEKLGNRFKIVPFDEIYGEEASRVLVNQKLKEASLKTNQKWIFNNYSPGKILLRDGRTGEFFDNPITVGKSYILKLIHLVEDKIHARARGPYMMTTEQPVAGKSKKGGQRFGEMEVWALEAYGCANTLQELLTIKSDDIDGRSDMSDAISSGEQKVKPTPSIPESFLVLIRELNALGLDFSMSKFITGFSSTITIKDVEIDLFKNLETRLKLRALLERKRKQQYRDRKFSKKKESVSDLEMQFKIEKAFLEQRKNKQVL